SGMNLKVNYPLLRQVNGRKELKVHKQLDNDLLILKLFPGINEEVLRSVLNCDRLKGVVLETFGTGNAINEDWFVELIEKTIKKGVYVVNVTQCVGGSVFMGRYETS